jgi:GNAT superfamily N-acetyltransferase
MDIRLRIGTAEDLPAINRVIDAAVMGWDLPERVKRLALPGYRYEAHDLEFLELIVATDAQDRIVGVAGCEPADPADTPEGRHALLLHGLFVLPELQRHGIGRRLLREAERRAQSGGFDSLLVKAQREASAFFTAQGMDALPVQDSRRDYAHRYWKRLATVG